MSVVAHSGPDRHAVAYRTPCEEAEVDGLWTLWRRLHAYVRPLGEGAEGWRIAHPQAATEWGDLHRFGLRRQDSTMEAWVWCHRLTRIIEERGWLRLLISDLTADGVRWSFGVCEPIGDNEVLTRAVARPVAAEEINEIERLTIEALLEDGMISAQEATSNGWRYDQLTTLRTAGWLEVFRRFAGQVADHRPGCDVEFGRAGVDTRLRVAVGGQPVLETPVFVAGLGLDDRQELVEVPFAAQSLDQLLSSPDPQSALRRAS